MTGLETIRAATSRLLQEAEASRDREQSRRLRGIADSILGALRGAGSEADEKGVKPAKGRKPALIMGDEHYGVE